MTTPVRQLAPAQQAGRGLIMRGLEGEGVMLVSQRSVQSFLAFAQHESYLAGIGHRTAAIEDSRLLPLSELPLEGAA